MSDTISLDAWGLKISDDLSRAEDALASAKERLRIVLDTRKWWEAELALRESGVAAKNAGEREARLQVAMNADERVREIRTSEHELRQELAHAESQVNRLTREFRLALARFGFEEARLRARATGVLARDE